MFFQSYEIIWEHFIFGRLHRFRATEKFVAMIKRSSLQQE